jgi:hypothetical protein
MSENNSLIPAPLAPLAPEGRRLLAFCLQHYDIRKNADDPLTLRISIAHFKAAYPEYMRYTPRDIYRVCEAMVDSIQKTGIPKDPAGAGRIFWFQGLAVTADGYIKFRLTPKAIPYFLDLKYYPAQPPA